MRVYICGPMRNVPLFNFPAFDAAKRDLENQGFSVVSPASIDRQYGFDPASLPSDYDWSKIPEKVGTLEQIIRRDVDLLLTCHLIYLLPGWENSTGAKAEVALARWASIGFVFNEGVKRPEHLEEQTDTTNIKEDILETALRITSGDRQNSYGPPDQDFRRTGDMWTALFRDKLKDGESFEPFNVAQAMILLKMSRQLHQRKADNWIDTAGYARCGAICDEAAATR